MAIGDLRETIFTDQVLTQFQGAVKDQFSQIKQVPFMNGALFSGVTLTSGSSNTLNHKLGRQATGYMILQNTANSNIWNDTISGSTSIGLHASVTTTVSVWVF